LVVLDEDGNPIEGNKFGAQLSIWRIIFNRDMDTTKQPMVTFGPAEPFTDFSVPGDWTDARTWEGSFTFSRYRVMGCKISVLLALWRRTTHGL
jgi:hypothetical protein